MSDSPLLPNSAELRLHHLVSETASLTIVVETARESVPCPECRQPTHRIHSRYTRTLADLPWSGVAVRIFLHTRKFFCASLTCPRRIFTERLPATAARYARRTKRLAEALQVLGFALGGEAGARLAKQLGMWTSPDALLDRMRQASVDAAPTPRVLGVDDWAWRKGHSYGTILVDLERRCVVDLLPDRQAETLACWLKQHPGVELISRDRAGVYAEGARQGAPAARQIADRWQLLANLSDRVREMLERRRPLLKQAMALSLPAAACSTESTSVTRPPLAFERRLLQAAERSRTARLARYQEVRHLHQQGSSERAIARQLGISRKVVRRFLAADQFPERAVRQARLTPLTPYHEYLQRRWTEGCHNAAQLLREINQQGYRGKRSSVRDFVARWREVNSLRAAVSVGADLVRTPSPRWAALLLLRSPEERTPQQQSFVDCLTRVAGSVDQVAALARQFVQIIRERQGKELDPWIERASKAPAVELQRFAVGLKRDYEAVRAALEEPWSNGPVEGQIHRLKLIKRQMYGRGKLDLLALRLRQAA